MSRSKGKWRRDAQRNCRGRCGPWSSPSHGRASCPPRGRCARHRGRGRLLGSPAA
jgi:hypothetical protein